VNILASIGLGFTGGTWPRVLHVRQTLWLARPRLCFTGALEQRSYALKVIGMRMD